MTYRVYIKKDYKPEVTWVGTRKNSSYLLAGVAFCSLTVLALVYFAIPRATTSDIAETSIVSSVDQVPSTTNPTSFIPAQQPETFNVASSNENDARAITVAHYESTTETPLDVEVTSAIENIAETTLKNNIEAEVETAENVTSQDWQTVTVKSGDSMALIFSRMGLSPNELYRVMSLGKEVTRFKKIKPGQIIHFNIVDAKLLGIEYEFDLTNTLSVTLQENEYKSELVKHELESVVKNASTIINDSLFMAGKKSGLSDNLIMQMVAIYGWDIDFALDIRRGDSFTLIYEEKYKNGVKVSDGPILAAEFNNRGHAIRAIRYAHTDGRIDYYDDNGDAMRKAFLRSPVNFSRISSHFNLNRKHPILNKIRAHKGVDYAASTGTPIKATGDGTIAHAGNKGGYGKTVILKHGGNYSTVYAHLHKYANGIRTGKRVKQGQIIGYVGMSGLATGPHLHYEFRINGVHRNPLTVKLPHVESINKKDLPVFAQSISPMLAELDRLTGKTVLASKQPLLTENTINPVINDGG